jgi:hypothetical protein
LLQEETRTATYHRVKRNTVEKLLGPRDGSTLKAPIDKEQRIEAQATVRCQGRGDWAPAPLLLDCGAEINTVDEKFAL